jgi:carboxymethylenebutenolidase
MAAVPISQVVRENILAQFTHDQVMNWLVPGVSPSGKRVEAGAVGIITFENGKIASEHLYWDHASVLAQLGVLDPSKLPVKGNEGPRTLLQWAGVTPVNK